MEVPGVTPMRPNERLRNHPGPSRPRQPARIKLPPADEATEAMGKLIADTDGLNDILNELLQVQRHMAVLMRRIKRSTGKLSLGEITQQDLDRKLNELKAMKMGEIENGLTRLTTANKDIWKEIEQLSQGINAALDAARNQQA